MPLRPPASSPTLSDHRLAAASRTVRAPIPAEMSAPAASPVAGRQAAPYCAPASTAAVPCTAMPLASGAGSARRSSTTQPPPTTPACSPQSHSSRIPSDPNSSWLFCPLPRSHSWARTSRKQGSFATWSLPSAPWVLHPDRRLLAMGWDQQLITESLTTGSYRFTTTL